jgi:hypothetical protein
MLPTAAFCQIENNRIMRFQFIFSGIAFLLLFTFCTPQSPQADNMQSYAESRKEDLRLSTYVTARAVERLLSTVEGRREAISILRANGINKLYVEVYRSGLVVSPDLLQDVTNYFTQNGFEVVGGIATVPGGKLWKALLPYSILLLWMIFSVQLTPVSNQKKPRERKPGHNTAVIY